MILRIGSSKRDYIRYRSDSHSWFCWGVFPDGVRSVICRFYWAAQGPASPGFSDSYSPWSTGDMASWCRTWKSGTNICQHSQSTCSAWVSLWITVSFSSMELSRKHAGRAVCFVWLFSSVYRVWRFLTSFLFCVCLLPVSQETDVSLSTWKITKCFKVMTGNTTIHICWGPWAGNESGMLQYLCPAM
jgi:hypothetical protein